MIGLLLIITLGYCWYLCVIAGNPDDDSGISLITLWDIADNKTKTVKPNFMVKTWSESNVTPTYFSFWDKLFKFIAICSWFLISEQGKNRVNSIRPGEHFTILSC